MMIERTGHILSIRDGIATVSVARAPACSACGSRGLCGSGRAADMQVELAVPSAARAGDTIALVLPEGALARGALLAYLLPALAMLTGAIALAGAGDAASAAGALSGLGLGLITQRILGRRAAGCATPHIHTPPIGDAS